jgi:drug/metabolite transporter (DMT)-like permease
MVRRCGAAIETVDSVPMARFAPLVFVLLWSTGYIGAKYGLPYAPPLTFLFIRLALASLLLLALALILKTPFPRGPQWWHSFASGLLLHVGYLGGVFIGINQGVSAGISAIVVNLQPVLTSSLAARLLGETVTARQWLGMGLGLVGVSLAVSEKFLGALGSAVPVWGLVACGVSLLSSTAGTIYQKRFGMGIPLVTGTLGQYLASSLVFLLGAVLFEGQPVRWTIEFVFALFWFVVVISLGAILLLLWLLRQHSAAQVSSLFYLVPPLTAVEAYLLFGERLGVLALVGLALCAAAVALVVTPARAASTRPQK